MRRCKKFLLYSFLLLAIFPFTNCGATIAIGYIDDGLSILQDAFPIPEAHPITAQEEATHMVIIDGHALCTATAIAPHALMTAHHCNPHGYSGITLDYSTHEYKIQKVLTDGQDHDIYLLNGSSFSHTIRYDVRRAKVGEYAYLWGDGEGIYPSRKLSGHVVPMFDPSDVDFMAGEAGFDFAVIHGDSGSAIYGADGKIIAITTYLFNGKNYKTVGFLPAFTSDQLAEAESFVALPDAPKRFFDFEDKLFFVREH